MTIAPGLDVAAPAPAAADWERLRARFLLSGHARKAQLADLLADRPWTLDLVAGTATFGDLTSRISLLGNEASETRTWRWGWALPGANMWAPGLTGRADKARTRIAGPPFTDPDVATDQTPAWELALIAAAAGPAAGVYRGPHPGGSLYFTVDDVPLPPRSTAEIVALVGQVLPHLGVDHQLAVTGLLYDEGFHLYPAGSAVRAVRGPDELTARFDGGRLTGLTD